MTVDYKSLLMGDVMVMTPSPVFIDSRATVSEAEQTMDKYNIRHLPVMKKGCLETIITRRDVHHLTLPGHQCDSSEDLLVADIHANEAYVADANDPLAKVVDIMAAKHISAVIVLREGEVCGIFTEADACRLLAEIIRPKREP